MPTFKGSVIILPLSIVTGKQVMEMTGVDFNVFTLKDDFDRKEFYTKFGEGSTFPQIICDDNKLGGCVDTIKFLRERQLIKYKDK